MSKEKLERRQRELSAKIGRAKKSGQDSSDLIEQNREVSRRIQQIEAKLAEEESDQTASAEDTPVTNVLTTTEAFRDLRDEWGELISKANVYSPFMMWEWLYPWWKFFGRNKRLRLITVRNRQNRLVGLAPMMLGFTEDGRCHPRVMAFLGSGEEGPRGQYFTFIADPARREVVLGAIIDCLCELRGEWLVMRLWRLRQDDVYHDFLDVLSCYDELAAIVQRKGTTVHGPLPSTMKDFIASVPSKRRRQYLRNQEHNLKKTFNSVGQEVCGSVDELPRFVSTIHELNIRRHQAKGMKSSWLASDKQACFEEAATLLFASASFRAELLHLDGQPVAGIAGIIRDGTYFAFELGFVPEFARDQVGHVLLGLCIQDCINSGLTHFDMLSTYDYMYQYFSDEQTVLQITVFQHSSSSLRHIGSSLWLEGVKAPIKRLIRWPQIKRLLYRRN